VTTSQYDFVIVGGGSGGNDLAAWKRLLAEVDFRDPRRSLAASQVSALRASLATSPSRLS
jgi:hypothetical protein